MITSFRPRAAVTTAVVLAAMLLIPLAAAAAPVSDAVRAGQTTRVSDTAHRDVRRLQHATYRVGHAGSVRISWTPTRIVHVEARAHRGWRYEIERTGRDTVHVAFVGHGVAVVFTAHLTEDGALRTGIHRRVHDRRPDDREPARRPDAAPDAAGTDG